MRRLLACAVLAIFVPSALADGPFTSLSPEAFHPDSQAPMQSDPYAGLIAGVQKQLHALGFHPGPVNGEWNSKTQAALTQFQLSRAISASGQLDDPTLAELGVSREQTPAAAGGSTETQSQ